MFITVIGDRWSAIFDVTILVVLGHLRLYPYKMITWSIVEMTTKDSYIT